jgi:hypothetical protein
MDTALTAPAQPRPDQQAADAPWRFQKGESGNPGGRPKGARNRATLLMEQLLGAEIEGVTRAAVGRAMGGDVAAMRLCFQRIAPIVRSRPVVLDLPPNPTVADLAAAMTQTLRALGAGDITPSEAEQIGRVLDIQRRIVETVELEHRLAQLEAMVGAQPCYVVPTPA